MTTVVWWFLCQSVVVLCVLLQHTRKSENLSPQSLMRFHAFALPSEYCVKAYAAADCPLLYLCYERKKRPDLRKNQTLILSKAGQLDTFIQRPPAFVSRPSPLPNVWSFRVHHSQIQNKYLIQNKQNYSQDDRLFVVETISDFSLKKFYTYNILQRNEKNT